MATTISKVLRRPLQYITPEEISYFMRSNRAFKDAWTDLAPYMRERDIRGVKRWVFAMGWLACAQFYRQHIIAMAEAMAERTVREAQKISDDFARRTGVPE